MRKLSEEQGFTITEMMVATAVVLVVLSGALTTFKNALAINESASQLADANQNLRAGTNQLIRDILMAHLHSNAAQVSVEIGRGSVPSEYQPSFQELENSLNNIPPDTA